MTYAFWLLALGVFLGGLGLLLCGIAGWFRGTGWPR
jgi:hypothetical protein